MTNNNNNNKHLRTTSMTQTSLSVGGLLLSYGTTYLAKYYQETFSVIPSILSMAHFGLQLVEGVVLVAFLFLRLSTFNPSTNSRLNVPNPTRKLALMLLVVHHLIHTIGVKSSTFLDCPALTLTCKSSPA